MKAIFILTAACLCGIETAHADNSSAGDSSQKARTSVEEVVRAAVEKNPELKFYEAQIAAANGERRNAGTLANPELSTQIGAKHAKDAETGMTGDGIAWSVSAMQPFEYPGRMGLRKAIANRQIELAELGLQQFRAALAGKTRAAALKVLDGRAEAEAAEEVAQRLSALTEVLVQREPAGVTPLLETRIIEANAITAQRKAAEAKRSAKVAELELNLLRGEPSWAEVQLSTPAIEFIKAPTSAELADIAATNSFDLKLRRVELEQQGFRVSLARKERFPVVSAGPFYSEEETGRVGEKERTVGLGLTMPLPLWNRGKGNIEAAQAREEQAAASLRSAQREVERRVVESAALLKARVEEMERWRSNAIEELKEAAALADRHYRLGAVPLATYVELQKQYLDAVEAILESKREALVAAQELEILTGHTLYRLTPGKTQGAE